MLTSQDSAMGQMYLLMTSHDVAAGCSMTQPGLFRPKLREQNKCMFPMLQFFLLACLHTKLMHGSGKSF